MTESAWMVCNEPARMLDFLLAGGKLTERKARLFGIAVCRHYPSTELDPWDVIEPAEQNADQQKITLIVRAATRDADGGMDEHREDIQADKPIPPWERPGCFRRDIA